MKTKIKADNKKRNILPFIITSVFIIFTLWHRNKHLNINI